MSESRLLQIRESIALAREREADSQRLQNFIEAKLPQLHHAIHLPDEDAAQQLMGFVTSYIERVPDFIQAIQEHCEEAKLEKFSTIFINIIEDYFLSPPELTQKHEDLHALIDEAYLAHRLIEELNDRLMLLCGSPLIPMDMTLSNIIVHDLIGEEFANELDLAVHYSMEMVFNSGDFLTDILADQELFCKHVELQHRDWAKIVEKWPCLAGDSSISLSLSHEPVRLDSSADNETVH
ncbi:hypothetical protein TDB9533_03260 [Thalassocella blandensis]|nr:hypothetical protein TDB9533_03260 [Thalassocella blandensis]